MSFLLAPVSAPRGQEIIRTAAVVNNHSISVTDVVDRTRLLIFSAGQPDTPEVRRRYMQQVLRTLIDESLQIQEAKSQGISLRESTVEKELANIARENNVPEKELGAFLAASGVTVKTLEAQVRAKIAWSEIVSRRLQRQAVVGNDDVDEALRRLRASSGLPRRLLSDIFLAVDNPANDETVRQSAMRIVQQIKNGANFSALARAFSQSNTAASGGDLGWLVSGQLSEALERTVARMQPGQVSIPIKTFDGYHILLLRDRRHPGGGSPDQVTVHLKQITLLLSAAPDQEEFERIRATTESIRANVTGCDQTGAIADLPGPPSVSDLGTLTIADLEPRLQAPLMALTPGQVSMPIRGRNGEVVMYLVCERTAPEEELPDAKDIRTRLEREKLDLLMRRYMRDLRRAATLDIRI